MRVVVAAFLTALTVAQAPPAVSVEGPLLGSWSFADPAYAGPRVAVSVTDDVGSRVGWWDGAKLPVLRATFPQGRVDFVLGMGSSVVATARSRDGKVYRGTVDRRSGELLMGAEGRAVKGLLLGPAKLGSRLGLLSYRSGTVFLQDSNSVESSFSIPPAVLLVTVHEAGDRVFVGGREAASIENWVRGPFVPFLAELLPGGSVRRIPLSGSGGVNRILVAGDRLLVSVTREDGGEPVARLVAMSLRTGSVMATLRVPSKLGAPVRFFEIPGDRVLAMSTGESGVARAVLGEHGWALYGIAGGANLLDALPSPPISEHSTLLAIRERRLGGTWASVLELIRP